MKTNIAELKEKLILRLVDQGIDSNMIPGFIRSLAAAFTYQLRMDLQQVNDRMRQTG